MRLFQKKSKQLLTMMGRYLLEDKAKELSLAIEEGVKSDVELINQIKSLIADEKTETSFSEQLDSWQLEAEETASYLAQQIDEILKIDKGDFTEDRISRKLDELRIIDEERNREIAGLNDKLITI